MAHNSPETLLDDDRLIQKIMQRGQSAGAMQIAQDAFGQLYRRHARRLLGFLASSVKQDDIDDLHQDVWERVWRNIPEHYRSGNFRAWLHKIARNALIDNARRGRLEPLEHESALPDVRDDQPDAPLIEQERMTALQHCLERLDEVAATLVRARLRGDGYHAVCLRLNITPQRAHKLFHKTKEQLQTCVERALE